MAQKVQVLLIDDIDGSEAEGTVQFMLDGNEYEIDLSAGNAGKLRKSLRDYVDHGRRAPRSRSGHSRRTSPISNTAVRQWAKAQGIDVKDRGRVPAEIIARYRAAGN